MTTDSIEFTDRYGGRAPSWLRSCHGDCEATGVVPEPPKVEGGEWTFEPCVDCNGTGRISWWATVRRVPRWLVRGVRTMRGLSVPYYWQGHPATRTQRAWLVFKIAFLCDLGVRP